MGQEITEGQAWVHESMAYLHETCHMAWRFSRSTPYQFPKTTGLQRHFSVQESQTGLPPFTGTYQPPMPTRVSWYLLWHEAHVLESPVSQSSYMNYTIRCGNMSGHTTWASHGEHLNTHAHTHTALHLYGFTPQNNPLKKAKQVLSFHPTSEKKHSFLSLWEGKQFAQIDWDSGALGSESTAIRHSWRIWFVLTNSLQCLEYPSLTHSPEGKPIGPLLEYFWVLWSRGRIWTFSNMV